MAIVIRIQNLPPEEGVRRPQPMRLPPPLLGHLLLQQ